MAIRRITDSSRSNLGGRDRGVGRLHIKKMKISTFATATIPKSFEQMAMLENHKVSDKTYEEEWHEMKPQIGDLIEGIGQFHHNVTNLGNLLSEVQNTLENMKAYMKMDVEESIVEGVLSRFESLLILIFDCMRRNSLADMLLPMAQYIKTWAPNKSFSTFTVGLLTKILSENEEGEPVEFVGESGDTNSSGWFTTNWSVMTQGQFGKRLAGAINLLIMVGLFPKHSTNIFGEELYKTLHLQAMRREHPSILHHLFGTIDWMIDSVIPAITTKNMSLLLFDEDYVEIDEMYRNSLNLVQLSKTGQMEEAGKKYGITDEAALIVYLTNTSAAHHAILSRSKNDKAVQAEMNKRLINLDRLATDITAFWHSKGLRQQPLGVLIRGPSSIGKSSLANVTCHTICKKMNFPQGTEYCVTLNGNDKYQSEFRTQHVCVIFDDVGNTKPERAEGNPLFTVIQFINNMHCAALSPEAEKKGKNDIRSRIVIVTTNTTDLHSSFFSINPASIMRRFSIVVDCSLRKNAMDDCGGIHEKFAGQVYPDAWEITISKIKVIRSSTDIMKDKWMPETVLATDIRGYIEYLGEFAPSFYARQDKVVEASTSLHEREDCPIHPLFVMPCPCCEMDSKKQMQPEVGEVDEASFASALTSMTSVVPSQIDCVSRQNDFLRDYYVCPEFDDDGLAVEDDDFRCTMSLSNRIDYICGLSWAKSKDLISTVKKAVEREPWMRAIGLVATLGATAFAVHKYLSPKPMVGEGAVLSRIANAARTPQNFVEKDNTYQKVYSNSIPFPNSSVSSSLEQLEKKIDRNLHVIILQEFDEKSNCPFGKKQWANAFPVGGGNWVIVGHHFDDAKTYEVTFQTHPSIGVKRFTVLLDSSNYYRIPENDVVVAYIPRGGDTCDFSKYMLDTMKDFEYRKGMPLTVYHAHISRIQGEPEDYVPPSDYKLNTEIQAIESIPVTGVGKFDLLTYSASNHNGMCGSMIFLAGRNPILLGVHSAGDVAREIGAATLLSRDMLVRPSNVIKISEENDFNLNPYGKTIEVSSEVHHKNPIHFLEEPDHNVEVIGQQNLPTGTFNSEVIESPLLPAMIERMGYVQTHANPEKKAALPSRRRHMIESTAHKRCPIPKYLSVAIKDVKAKLKPLVESKVFKEHVHPLTYEQALNGVPGVRGFDPVNPKTAMSHPFTGPKHRFFKECELSKTLNLQTTKFVSKQTIDGKEVYVYELEFDPEKADVPAEVERLLQLFLDGIRANLVFKTNLKDEAVTYKKIANNKIRIFAGAPTAFVIVSRMLTLPLTNMMNLFPEEFESAVGIDATGKDWHELARFMTYFGEERCGDGDFSAYDTSIRPEFTAGAFEIIKFCLLSAGFNEELISIFDGIATECMFPVYDTMSFLFKSFGTNPSGQPLTVIINGLANILYMRYAYYSKKRVSELGEVPLFHEVVKLMTYGDDNFFNVSPKEKDFNMITVGEQLATIDMKYTDASKEISQVPFKPFSEISFLKRTFHIHPVLKARVGALEKGSIFKSLALTRKPKKGQRESIAEICAGNLRSAQRELYFHSPEEFEHYSKIFKLIAEESRDSEGHLVMDYYKPITQEEIVEMYNKTTTSYPKAKEKAFSGQSGEIPSPAHEGLNELRFVLIASQSYYNPGRFPAYDWFVNEVNNVTTDYEITKDGESEFLQFPTCMTEERVKRRFEFVDSHYDDFGVLLMGDVRLSDNFRFQILSSALERHVRSFKRARLSALVQYIWKYAQSPHAILKPQDEKAFKLVRNLYKVKLDLPQELIDQVKTYFEGKFLKLKMPHTIYVNESMRIIDTHMHCCAWDNFYLMEGDWSLRMIQELLRLDLWQEV